MSFFKSVSDSHPGSLGHPLDVDRLGVFEGSLQVEGPKVGSAFFVDEEAAALKAICVSSCHDGVAVQENTTNTSVSMVI